MAFAFYLQCGDKHIPRGKLIDKYFSVDLEFVVLIYYTFKIAGCSVLCLFG